MNEKCATSTKTMPERDVSELSLRSLFIASLAWMVVSMWSGFFNTLFDGVAERMGAQNGMAEVAMRFVAASAFTALALYVARCMRPKKRVKFA